MNLKHNSVMMTLVVLTVVATTNVPAAEIYHWVDESGVSHYSQQPPSRDTPDVSTQKIVAHTPSDNGQVEDIYNTVEHEKRMAAWREEREQERKDARDRKNQAASKPIRYQQPESYGTTPYLFRPIYRPPHRPIYPERPIYNPRPPTSSLSRGG